MSPEANFSTLIFKNLPGDMSPDTLTFVTLCPTRSEPYIFNFQKSLGWAFPQMPPGANFSSLIFSQISWRVMPPDPPNICYSICPSDATRSELLALLIFKISWRGMPPDPLTCVTLCLICHQKWTLALSFSKIYWTS